MNESLLHALGAETLRQDRKRRHDAEASLSGHSDITTPSNADETACAAENNTAENAADISIDISVDMIASALVKDRVYNSVGLLLNYARERCILSGPARSFVLRSTWATFVVMQGMNSRSGSADDFIHTPPHPPHPSHCAHAPLISTLLRPGPLWLTMVCFGCVL